MSPTGPVTAAPPLPPQIASQQQMSPAAMYAQMGAQAGGGIPDPISILESKIAELEQWASETAPVLSQVNPALTTLMVPIAQAGKALQAEIANLRQRTQGPSPQVAGSNPPNVPGNIPDGQPAA